MDQDGWKKRLVAALEQKGLTLRKASLAAGKGAGYVHSLLAEGKDPSVTNLMALCEATGISGAYVLFGFEVDPATEDLMRLVQKHPDRRDAILQLLGGEAPQKTD